LLTLAVVIPFAVLTVWVARLNSRLQQRMFQVIGAMFAELRQVASLPRAFLIRALGLEREQASVMSAQNRLINRLGLVQSLRGSWFGTVHGMEGQALNVVFWTVGGMAIMHGSLTLGVLTAIMTYANTYIGLGGGIDSYVSIYGVLANVDRVSSYMQHQTEPFGKGGGEIPAFESLVLSICNGNETQRLEFTPGTVQRINGTPEFLADVRNAILRLRPVEGIEIQIGEQSIEQIPLDDWRQKVAWLTLDFPFNGVSIQELLQWSAATQTSLEEAKRFFQKDVTVTNWNLDTERWTQGRQPNRVVQLLEAICIARQPRLVLVELSDEWGESTAIVRDLGSRLDGSAFVLLGA